MIPQWRKLTPEDGPVPKPRHGHRGVSVKDLIIFFGGGSNGIFNELIVYNTSLNRWFYPAVKGDVPPGRAAYGFALHKSRIIMFGGMVEFNIMVDECYELHFTRWEWNKVQPTPPSNLKPPPIRRIGHSFTAVDGKIYLFGGLTMYNDHDLTQVYTCYLNDLYVLDLTGNEPTWTLPFTYGKSPSPRESHTAIAHVNAHGNRNIIIFGGMDGERLNDVWLFSIDSMTWSEVHTSSPQVLPRSLHSAVMINDKMYVFGGWVSVKDGGKHEWTVNNQLLSLDLNTMTWHDLTDFHPTERPKARAGHCAVENNGRLFIWSGREGYRKSWGDQVCFDDMWVVDLSPPKEAPRLHLDKAQVKSLEIRWDATPHAGAYLLEIQKYQHYKYPFSPCINLTGNCDYSQQCGRPTKAQKLDVPPLLIPSNSVPVNPPLKQLGKESVVNASKTNSPASLTASQEVNPPLATNKTVPTKPNFVLVKTQDGRFTFQKWNDLPIKTLKPVVLNKAMIPLIPKGKNLQTLGSNLSKLTIPQGSGNNQVNAVKWVLPSFIQKDETKVIPGNQPLIEANTKRTVPLPTKNSNAIDIKKNKIPTNSHIVMSTVPRLQPAGSVMKLPDQPKKKSLLQVKVLKSPRGGITLSWNPPTNTQKVEHCVSLFVKSTVHPSGQKIVYKGEHPECYLSKEVFADAEPDQLNSVPSVKLMISTKYLDENIRSTTDSAVNPYPPSLVRLTLPA